ncbi:MAG: hypothetical protein ICV83_02690 [Cytophagales bacterium]|nr:hypothetical protein [Cytophagales bacterium]
MKPATNRFAGFFCALRRTFTHGNTSKANARQANAGVIEHEPFAAEIREKQYQNEKMGRMNRRLPIFFI